MSMRRKNKPVPKDPLLSRTRLLLLRRNPKPPNKSPRSLRRLGLNSSPLLKRVARVLMISSFGVDNICVETPIMALWKHAVNTLAHN